MDTTAVVIAAIGLASTIFAAWFGSRWKRNADIDAQLVQSRLQIYGRCVATLSEFRRATYNRVTWRIEGRPDDEKREAVRREAHQANALARAAIGEAAIVSESTSIADGFEAVRAKISALNEVDSRDELKRQADQLEKELELAIDAARRNLRPS